MTITHISQSMINLYCNCQEAFCRRYIMGEIIPPALAMAIGTGLHCAAEKNHKQKIDSGFDISLEEIEETASQGFLNEIETKGVYFAEKVDNVQKELGQAQDLSVNLARQYLKSVAPQINPVEAELSISVQHPELNIPFMGIADVITSDDTCIDLKTAKAKWRKGKEKESVQPILYRYLLENTYQKNYTFGFHVLAYNGDVQYIPIVTSNQDMDKIVGISKAIINSVDTGIYMPAVLGHWICQKSWCGYWHTCKVKST